MLPVRNLLKNNVQFTKNVMQLRNMTAIATPARQKVTKGEMIFLGGAMVVGWLTVPAWVLVNMKHYRDKE